MTSYREALKREHVDSVRRLVVYGSKARGDAHNESDVDLLLIVRNDAADLMRALSDGSATTLLRPPPSHPRSLAYTEREWDTLKELRSPYRAAVERDGVTIL